MASLSNDDSVSLSSPLLLACGQTLPNRTVKAALSECMADGATNLPNKELHTLYARWAKGGIGAQLTGNVQVDRRYLESPCNVALEAHDEQPERLALFRDWATAIQHDGAKAIMQLSHCGRQCPYSVCSSPLAPSAVPLRLPGLPAWAAPVGHPREMSAADISDVIARFATSARLACLAGFDGVQLHSAHGYLLSSFLSAKANRRADGYGGSAANRRRLLLEVVAAVRDAVGPAKIVCVKLNSADFQHGGLTEQESMDCLRALTELRCDGSGPGAEGRSQPAVDFVEISGGTYENAKMMKSLEANARDHHDDAAAATGALSAGAEAAAPNGVTPAVRESTLLREAFFLDFCESARQSVPGATLMLTGGWRSGVAMARAVRSGAVQLIGLGRPLCVSPDFPLALLSSPQLSGAQLDSARSDAVTLPCYSLALRTPFAALNKTCEAALENFAHQALMKQMGQGREPDLARQLTLSATAYFLTVRFVRAYIYEPQRKPRRARAAAVAISVGGLALLAYALFGGARLRSFGSQGAAFGQQLLLQGQQRVAQILQ